MKSDKTKEMHIPKRVLNSVQRNVAVLVDLLKAEGITPEVDYEVVPSGRLVPDCDGRKKVRASVPILLCLS